MAPPPPLADTPASIGLNPMSDAHWSTVLKLCRVPGYPGVYILGSFARRVTFYSQQIRALNLIDVLCKSGEVHERSEIGIVGAGVAGVTAAVAGARRGVKVTLFEKHRDRDNQTTVLPRQRLSDERAVHPFVYDWPAESPGLVQQRAGLPLMDWTAGTAAEVVKSLADQFDEARATGITLCQADFKEHMMRLGDGPPVVVEVPGLARMAFDAVILALGFGEEEGQSYWNNDGLQSRKGEWLVSGTGDGGLTDLMRLCIDNFRHAEVVTKFGERGREAALKLLDADASSDDASRSALYRKVGREIVERLHDDHADLGLREVSVWLTGTEDVLFSPGASILNRLIAAYLLERKAFRFIPHWTVSTTLLPNGKTAVVFTDDWKTNVPIEDLRYPVEFDGAVLRHGPKSALAASFPKLFARCRSLRREWDATPPAQDPTRRVLWFEGDFDAGSMAPLDVDSRLGPFVVVVEGPVQADTVSLSTLAESALGRALDRDQTPPRIVSVNPERDLATAHGYRRILRALCRSEIAIVDITDRHPVTMLLLGIRSVVRRGITLSTLRVERSADDVPEPFDIPDLPFNIRETSVIARRGDNNAFTESLKDSIVAGRNQLDLLANEYQDLPAYDGVRKLGPRPESHRPIAPTSGVLVLSSYEKAYLKGLPGQIVATALGTALPARQYKWLRIVQSPSPQLASQKLYAAIRQTQMCVFDWTGWRANLFFELGVRLAVNQTMPACIGHRLALDEPGPERRTVLDLFAPFAYDKLNQNSALVPFLKSHLSAIETATPLSSLSGLSPTFTFQEVQRWADVASEAPLRVDLALEREAAALVGPDLKMYTEVPLLYRGNDVLMREAQRAALDRWIAAWYFLDKRYGIWKQVRAAEKLPEDSNVQRWVKLATHIQTMMETVRAGGYEDIKAEVDEAVKVCVEKG